MTTGCEGHMFGARMPFSWLLINLINDILSQTQPAQEPEGIFYILKEDVP